MATSLRELPLALQTNYAELLDQLRFAQPAELGADLTYRLKTIRGHSYWYARSPAEDGVRRERYLGRDTQELRAVIEGKKGVRDDTEGRRRIVKGLVASGLTSPDQTTGKVLKALAEAGVFRLRGLVVGTVAFQMYGGGLGVFIPGAAMRTSDLDIAQDFGVPVSIDDEIDGPIAEVLRGVNPAFRTVPSLDNPLSAKTFALPNSFRVDVLTTNRGSGRETSRLKALQSDATPLRFMDFLLRDPIDAVALYDDGVLVRVPNPARYAVHKLLVARRRHIGSGKSPKDLMQAEILIELLGRKDPFALRDIYSEARERGPEWRKLLDEALTLLPESTRATLEKT